MLINCVFDEIEIREIESRKQIHSKYLNLQSLLTLLIETLEGLMREIAI